MLNHPAPIDKEYTDFHFFCGAGGAAMGFARAGARVGSLRGRFRSLGGIDSNPAACADFAALVGTPATCLDLFTDSQYRRFHDAAPPVDWAPVTHHDIRAAAGFENPDVVFLSPPCKGFSGLLSKSNAKSAKYTALNDLVIRSVHLMMAAWGDDPPSLILIENVPRIQQRGRSLLDEVIELLDLHGYAVAETTHDCGELGGLAQHRKRFLLVARHRSKVSSYLYEPPKKRIRAVGEVLDSLPLPETDALGPMHRCPRLQWRTWVRLALIPAGSDWRALQDLDWERYRIESYGQHHGKLRVEDWDKPAHTVTTSDRVGSGALSIADPRVPGDPRWHRGVLGVGSWDAPTGTVKGRATATTGAHSVADPRLQCDVTDRKHRRFNNVYQVIRYDDASPAVTGGTGPSAGGVSVADPRHNGWGGGGKYRVTRYDEATGAVIAASTTGTGAFALADPRPPRDLGQYSPYGVLPWDKASGTVTGQAAPGAGVFSVADPRVRSKAGRTDFRSSGHYGVLGWDESAKAVTANGQHDNGWNSVADPRVEPEFALAPIPADKDRPDPIPVIVSLDGTWHRPFTTLELAALQGFPVLDPRFAMDGRNHEHWRERIGNAVPVDTGAAIGSTMLHCLLLQEAGVAFQLSETPIWVQPIAIALSMDRTRPELEVSR